MIVMELLQVRVEGRERCCLSGLVVAPVAKWQLKGLHLATAARVICTWRPPALALVHIHVRNEGNVVDRRVQQVFCGGLAGSVVDALSFALRDRASVGPDDLHGVLTILDWAVVGRRVDALGIGTRAHSAGREGNSRG